jgi:hypothetical protein
MLNAINATLESVPRRIPLGELLVFALLAPAAAREASAEDWPRWRGPAGNAVSSEEELPVEWSPTQNVAWKA